MKIADKLNLTLKASDRTEDAIGPVKLTLRESWRVLNQLYPTERWYQLLVRLWNIKRGKLDANYQRELSVEAVYGGFATHRFGGPGAYLCGEYTERGKIVKPSVHPLPVPEPLIPNS